MDQCRAVRTVRERISKCMTTYKLTHPASFELGPLKDRAKLSGSLRWKSLDRRSVRGSDGIKHAYIRSFQNRDLSMSRRSFEELKRRDALAQPAMRLSGLWVCTDAYHLRVGLTPRVPHCQNIGNFKMFPHNMSSELENAILKTLQAARIRKQHVLKPNAREVI